MTTSEAMMIVTISIEPIWSSAYIMGYRRGVRNIMSALIMRTVY